MKYAVLLMVGGVLVGLVLGFAGGRALFRRFRKSKAVVEVKEEKKK